MRKWSPIGMFLKKLWSVKIEVWRRLPLRLRHWCENWDIFLQFWALPPQASELVSLCLSSQFSGPLFAHSLDIFSIQAEVRLFLFSMHLYTQELWLSSQRCFNIPGYYFNIPRTFNNFSDSKEGRMLLQTFIQGCHSGCCFLSREKPHLKVTGNSW